MLEVQKEVRNALSVALEANILKPDSALAVNLSETWAAHANFEEVLALFKATVTSKQAEVAPEVMQVGEKLEQVAIDLKNAVTNSIKQIEETKLSIIKILSYQDNMLHKVSQQAN